MDGYLWHSAYLITSMRHYAEIPPDSLVILLCMKSQMGSKMGIIGLFNKRSGFLWCFLVKFGLWFHNLPSYTERNANVTSTRAETHNCNKNVKHENLPLVFLCLWAKKLLHPGAGLIMVIGKSLMGVVLLIIANCFYARSNGEVRAMYS